MIAVVLSNGSFATNRNPETFKHSDIPGVPAELSSLDVYADGRPEGAPVVIFVHGGGWVAGSKSSVQQSSQFLEFFEDRGMILVSVGTRLVFDARSPDATFREQATDIAAAVKWVRDNIRQHHGDPNHLFLLGYSAGAHLVALVGTDASYLGAHGLDPSALRGVAALDVSAYDIPRAIVEAPSQGVPVSPAALTRVFSADRQAQEAASPVYHVTAGRQYPPFLLVYGGIFDTNPEGVYEHTLTKVQSEAFAEALRKTGAHAEVYGEPKKTHRGIMRDFGSPEDGITAAVDAFFARYRE
ncbi:MAG TPA: alpha/beta hydrolase [Burkholderiales bacterium]|nr:alpha/beta hydrolase [Burkholderiales bacterium]